MDEITLKSQIYKLTLRKALMKGTFISSLGAFLLLFFGALSPTSFMHIWGFPIVILAFYLIYKGLKPYKNLKFLQLHPNTIKATSDRLNISLKEGNFEIPYATITSIEYNGNLDKYGITISPGPIFCPYFTKETFTELKGIFKDQTESDRASLEDPQPLSHQQQEEP